MTGLGKKTVFFFALVMALNVTFSAFGAQVGVLTVKVVGFPNDNGSAMIAVVDSAQAYESDGNKAVAKAMQKIAAGQARADFNLPYGWYAVSMYHDENGNEALDKNMFGIPREKYGFSNNAKGTMGKPGWELVKFEMKSPIQEIVINLE